MLAALMLSVAALTSVDDPIRVALSDRARYVTGDAGRVEVTAGEDGYLVVLQADASGAVRVLFPIEPSDDPFVRGPAKYQLRDRAGRAGVVRASYAGSGVVLAALSAQPLDFASVTRNGRWDPSVLKLDLGVDAEYALRDLAIAIAGDGLEYAAATFSVLDLDDPIRYAGAGWGGANVLGFGWGGGWGGFNRWGANPFFYDPFFGYGFGGWGYGYGPAFGGWGGFGGWGYGIGGRPIIVTPSNPRISGYEAKTRGRRWTGSGSPADRSRDSGGNIRQNPSPSRPAVGSSGSGGGSGSNGGGRSSSEGRGGRSWGGRPR